MNETPTRAYWMGRPIEDLTNAELIEAIIQLAEEQRRLREWHREELEALFPEAKK